MVDGWWLGLRLACWPKAPATTLHAQHRMTACSDDSYSTRLVLIQFSLNSSEKHDCTPKVWYHIAFEDEVGSMDTIGRLIRVVSVYTWFNKP